MLRFNAYVELLCFFDKGKKLAFLSLRLINNIQQKILIYPIGSWCVWLCQQHGIPRRRISAFLEDKLGCPELRSCSRQERLCLGMDQPLSWCELC